MSGFNPNANRELSRGDEETDWSQKQYYEDEIDFEVDKTMRRSEIEKALRVIHNDTKNSILLEAFNIYPQARTYRDEIIIRIGEVDGNFCKWILQLAEEDKRPVDID
ncbi:unnamed protein product [Blepharisma stoltei]|uniref:Uncharacterized protein n=1 Tax=Blepharisma stoltei TaxID=1481888 RepID=A0AAU9ILK1_9CILI|nr:unnamed protein product [Blepharisma stoltei]